MHRYFILALVALGTVFALGAQADVVVTLEARDSGGGAITGPVGPGTTLFVDILLSVDGEDDPLPDVRLLQFDFNAVSPSLEVQAFTWTFDPGQGSALYAIFDALPLPGAAYVGLTGVPDLILDLGDEPTPVASFEVVVSDNGTLDMVNPEAESSAGGALVQAGFELPVEYALYLDNLTGGTLELAVQESEEPLDEEPGDDEPGDEGDEPESDGDGVPDDEDAFPEDPSEAVDTDGNGVGDNTDSDDDGDGADDDEDDFPLDPAEVVDTDGDGVGNNADPDDNGDGVEDDEDDFPLDPTQSQAQPQRRGLCGRGLIGPSLLALCVLTAVRTQRAVGHRRRR